MTRGIFVWLCLLVFGEHAAFAQAQPVAATTTIAPGSEDPLLQQIDQAIKANGQRYLVPVPQAGTPQPNSPWQIFHGILAYKRELLLKVGDQKVSAIDWIATSEPKFDNLPLLLVTPHGAKFHPFTREYAFEGHPGQSVALLSESHLPVDFEFKIGEKKVTLSDFLNNTMMEVNNREEITWVLWGLINYVKPEAQWVNQFGEPWSIEKLVQLQVDAQVVTAPCGGNHGLFALVRARDKYLASGRQLRGVWLQADNKIKQYIEIARSLQNGDGSFSSEFYKGPGYSQDMNTRFNTTGHTFEFVSVGLPDSRLNEPWVRNAATMLSRELIATRAVAVNPGPLYHSVNGLMNYRDRVRALQPKQPDVALRPKQSDAAPQPNGPQPTQPEIKLTPKQPEIALKPIPKPATVPLMPSSSQPAPLSINPGEARPVPLPVAITPSEARPVPLPVPVEITPSKPTISPLLDPKAIQPGILSAEAPVSALAPVNR